MSVFTNFVSIKPLLETNEWITTKELTFYIDDSLEWEYIQVPCWFVFDWCSVFCPFWQWAEPKTIASCCLHDYMFRHKMGFWFSNLCFYRALRSKWVWRFKRIKYWLWVTLFWWLAYYRIIDRISAFIKERLQLSEKISSNIK